MQRTVTIVATTAPDLLLNANQSALVERNGEVPLVISHGTTAVVDTCQGVKGWTWSIQSHCAQIDDDAADLRKVSD